MRIRRAVAPVAAVAIIVVGVAMLVRTVIEHRREVGDALADASWTWLAAGALLALVSVAGLAERWRAALGALGARTPFGSALAMFTAGQLGKYAPGGLWQVVGQGELATRSGVPRRSAYASVMLSTITLVGGAAVVVAASRPTPFGSSTPAWAVVGGLAIAALVVEPHLRRRLLRMVKIDEPVATRRIVALVVGAIPTWLCIGVSTWCITRSLVPSAPVGPVVVAAVASWLVGIVTLPAPGGIGVREGVFAASLVAVVPTVGAGTAALVALVARLAFVIVDLAWLPLGRAVGGALSRSDAATPGPSSTATE